MKNTIYLSMLLISANSFGAVYCNADIGFMNIDSDIISFEMTNPDFIKNEALNHYGNTILGSSTNVPLVTLSLEVNRKEFNCDIGDNEIRCLGDVKANLKFRNQDGGNFTEEFSVGNLNFTSSRKENNDMKVYASGKVYGLSGWKTEPLVLNVSFKAKDCDKPVTRWD